MVPPALGVGLAQTPPESAVLQFIPDLYYSGRPLSSGKILYPARVACQHSREPATSMPTPSQKGPEMLASSHSEEKRQDSTGVGVPFVLAKKNRPKSPKQF